MITEERPPAVRVTMNGGESLTFENPEMVNDSLVGFTDSGVVRAAPADFSLLEIRHFSIVKTAALVASHFAVIAGFVAVVIWVQPHYRGF